MHAETAWPFRICIRYDARMSPPRLTDDDLDTLLGDWPDAVYDATLTMREFILTRHPHLAESMAYRSLCYYKPDVPYGMIGGNVCGLGWKPTFPQGRLQLGFVHGAQLPDPHHLLHGRGKNKRELYFASMDELDGDALAALIQAAVDYDPTAD
jgi:hypothetical protein